MSYYSIYTPIIQKVYTRLQVGFSLTHTDIRKLIGSLKLFTSNVFEFEL